MRPLTSLNTIQIERLKVVLETRLGQLSGGLQNRDTIAIEKAADMMDEAQLAEERDLAICILDRDSAEIRSVENALARIEQGTYGSCVRCAEEIDWKRLQAMPQAAFCVACQDENEHDGAGELNLNG